MAVHLGRGRLEPGAPVNVPVTFTSTYVTGAPIGYARVRNPSWEPFEEVLGALEGGRALAFASGLAAASAVIETLPVGAAVVLPADVYGGTRHLVEDLGSRARLEPRVVDMGDASAVADACAGAALLWIESPSNPLLRVSDITALAAVGHAAGALVAADNTFATPLRQRPLTLGADVVVHSATKLLAGHSDILMGAVVAPEGELFDALTTRRTLHGAIAGPMEAFLAVRGVRTLAVRLDRAESTAAVLAERLAGHAAVAVARYPRFGTVVSFDERGGAEAADRVIANLSLIVPATSLGGVETTIERRGKLQFEEYLPPGLLRLSVGLEHPDDVWGDLAQALPA
jgi:cystathionine gamma-synthase